MIIAKISKRFIESRSVVFATALNGAFWLYFWLAFASGHANDHSWGDRPVDPYVVLGHAIGLSKNPLTYGFMKAMFWVQFPSFCVATIIQRFFAGIDATVLFLGISPNGYRLIATMLMSFLQWYFIARLVSWLMGRRRQEVAAVAR